MSCSRSARTYSHLSKWFHKLGHWNVVRHQNILTFSHLTGFASHKNPNACIHFNGITMIIINKNRNASVASILRHMHGKYSHIFPFIFYSFYQNGFGCFDAFLSHISRVSHLTYRLTSTQQIGETVSYTLAERNINCIILKVSHSKHAHWKQCMNFCIEGKNHVRYSSRRNTLLTFVLSAFFLFFFMFQMQADSMLEIDIVTFIFCVLKLY